VHTPGTSYALPPAVVPAFPTPAPPAAPVWKQVWNSVKDGSFVQKGTDLAGDYVTEDLLLYLGVLLAGYVLLWLLPYQILKFFARRGDSDAGERLYNAKKLGAFSLVPFLVKKASQPRASRHRCPFCNKGIDSMEDYKDLNFIVCPHCREPITPIYDMKDYVDHLIDQLKISHKAGAKGKRGDLLIEKDAMLKLVRGVLALTIRRRSSDLHMETANEGGKVRARIDGIMYELITLPREISPAFISALKVMASLDITERRVPQDGKIALWLDQQDYDLRINTSPASMGEKVVIRILRQDSINITPARLGLDGSNLVIYERNIHKPHGVIIVTGPSGSGKSTTLYVALNELNSGDKNIVTIEDPIEYQLKGLSQMQVNPGANFTFATGLRSILRQDPDVIMVGEIRDKETAEAALDAAMTGHMVLTTLHTIDAPSAFSRMRDLGIEQARVANAVNLIIAQRLVRTICSDCRKAYKPKPADLEKLALDKAEDIQYVHGTGCETCMNTGYYGRLAIFEMLELTDSIKSQLEANAPTSTVRESARANGMRSLREEGIRKITEGVTTVEEVIRVTT
jgi:type II secretory ATPase GspE/PulE/Tfp pilus assembly ATPase PilB-like protein